MPRFFIRSTIYNIFFFGLTAIACVLCLPTLLMPRKAFMGVVHAFVFTNDLLEKLILGLKFEIRGLENLPAKGPYLIAAKHQSAYETTKLHILFDDPAIVLKQELLKIPLWGKYLAKSDVIAIDRSTPKAAVKSIQEGAKRMAAQGRPIIIFPQGTRVRTDTTIKEKPYKIGIVRLQEATNLPIIPMALNSGVYWPRNSWFKKPGKVIFEFLPPIEPDHGMEAGEVLKKIETDTENKTIDIMNEANTALAKRKKTAWLLPAFIILLGLAYTANWFIVAHQVKKSVVKFLADIENENYARFVEKTDPVSSGFPGKLKLSFGKHALLAPSGSITLDSLQAESWPLPNMPIKLEAKNITTKVRNWREPVSYDSLDALIHPKGDQIEIIESVLKKDKFESRVKGDIDLKQEPYPGIDLDVELQDYEPFVMELVKKKIVKQQPAMIAIFALKALEKDGIVHAKLIKEGRSVKLGNFKILELPAAKRSTLIYE